MVPVAPVANGPARLTATTDGSQSGQVVVSLHRAHTAAAGAWEVAVPRCSKRSVSVALSVMASPG